MPTPTNYSANLTFGGRVDSSLDKAVAQIQGQLKTIQKDAALFSENIASIGTGVLAIGTAFLGLRAGLDALGDLAEAGKNLSDITNQVGVNIGKMVSWSGRTKEFEGQIASFNLELRKTSVYATAISESFEAGLTGQGFKNLSQIETLTKRFELLAAHQNRHLTAEDSKAAADSLGTAVKTGGESGEQALQAMGLSLSWSDRLKYRAIQSYPGMQGQAYTAREQFIEGLLQKQAPENAFDEFRKKPNNASDLLGQEQSEFAGKIGQGFNTLFAPIQQELTKALQGIEQSGELEKFDTWSKGAGERLKSFFEKFIEPELPDAVHKLTGLLDKFGEGIDKLSGNLDKISKAWGWFQNPNPEHKNFGQRMGDLWNWASKGLGAANDDAASRLQAQMMSASHELQPLHGYETPGGGSSPLGSGDIYGDRFARQTVADITKTNTEATKSNTDSLTTLNNTMQDNLSFLQQQNQVSLLGAGQGSIAGAILGRAQNRSGTAGAGVSGGVAGNLAAGNYGIVGKIAEEEGLDNGYDAGHPSIAGLWGDKGGSEGAAYSALASMTPSERRGTKGMAVLNSIWSKMARSAHPERLKSPGMQELVMADSQHWGSGDNALGLINQMGGWDAINKMDPVDAINQYTNLRKSLWPGNSATDSSHRLGRERDWALKHAKSSTDEDSGTTHVIHYNVTVNAPGVYDAKGLSEHIKNGLTEHSSHLVRVLQDTYRDHQRVNYA